MAVAIRIAAPMEKAVKTTTAGDRIRDGEELVIYIYPLARAEAARYDSTTKTLT
jgi:hypothetical protein